MFVFLGHAIDEGGGEEVLDCLAVVTESPQTQHEFSGFQWVCLKMDEHLPI